MQKRSPVMVVILSVITCGIYGLWWYVTTKGEMNAKGAQIPTAWMIIVPILNLYWEWKFGEGVEKVTNKGMGAGTAFLLLLFLGIIGAAIIQSELNKVAA